MRYSGIWNWDSHFFFIYFFLSGEERSISWFQVDFQIAIQKEGLIENIVKFLTNENDEIKKNCAIAIFEVRKPVSLYFSGASREI